MLLPSSEVPSAPCLFGVWSRDLCQAPDSLLWVSALNEASSLFRAFFHSVLVFHSLFYRSPSFLCLVYHSPAYHSPSCAPLSLGNGFFFFLSSFLLSTSCLASDSFRLLSLSNRLSSFFIFFSLFSYSFFPFCSCYLKVRTNENVFSFFLFCASFYPFCFSSNRQPPTKSASLKGDC